MTNEEKLLKIAQKLNSDKVAKEVIKQKWAMKSKARSAMTVEYRLDRIEEILGLK